MLSCERCQRYQAPSTCPRLIVTLDGRLTIYALIKLSVHLLVRYLSHPCEFGTSQRAVMLCGWQCSHRSDVVLAMRHTCGLSGLDGEMSTPSKLRRLAEV